MKESYSERCLKIAQKTLPKRLYNICQRHDLFMTVVEVSQGYIPLIDNTKSMISDPEEFKAHQQKLIDLFNSQKTWLHE